MKIKTSELQGSALDWVAAKCLPDDTARIYFDEQTGEKLFFDDWEVPEFSPSTDWSQGGPIIEQEGLGVERDDQGVWFASYDLSADCALGATGATPLIAAMRCYVASKLGNEIEVPNELVEVKICS